MADYLIVRGENPNFVTQRAIEDMDLADGDSVTVYRLAAEPRVVKVREETVRRVEIE